LSLTNEPKKLANTALDALAQSMDVECCWIQTVTQRKDKRLSLAAERGLSDEMRSEIAAMNLNHDFPGQIIGMGQKIIIPDFSNDGVYELASFRNAGFKWLVAVPLMTYRVYGILGTASRNKKLLRKETADLFMVIAGLIAGALNKTHLSGGFTPQKKPVILSQPAKEVIADTAPSGMAPQKNLPAHKDTAFLSHARQMRSFRESHR
jgi:signal transduction protein with GAF and PtsI domain